MQWFGLSQIGRTIYIDWCCVHFAVFDRVCHEENFRGTIRVCCGFRCGSGASRRNSSRVVLFQLSFCSVHCCLAAMMNIVQSPQVDPKSGTGLELKTIAAVVVGGVAISGGRGNLWVYLLDCFYWPALPPALTHLHVEAYWEKAIQGALSCSQLWRTVEESETNR